MGKYLQTALRMLYLCITWRQKGGGKNRLRHPHAGVEVAQAANKAGLALG